MKLNFKKNKGILFYINLIISIMLVGSIFCMKMDKFSNYIIGLLLILGLLIMSIMFLEIIKNKIIKLNKLKKMWLIGILGMCLSSINSVNKGASIKYIVYYFIALSISIYISENEYMIDIIFKWIKIFSLIFAVFTIMPLVFKSEYLNLTALFFSNESIEKIKYFLLQNRYPGIGGFLGNNGFLLATGLAIYISEIMNKKIILNLIYVLKILLIIIAILLTGSRTMALTIVISFVICFFLKEKNSIISIIKKSMNIVILIALVVGIIIILYPEAINNLLFRFKDGDASIKSRLLLYGYAIQLFSNRFLLGCGINTFLGLTYVNPYMKENTYVHNVFLQLLAETGIVGTIMVLIPYFFTWIYTAFQISKEKEIKLRINLITSLFIQNMVLIYFLSGNPIYDYNILLIYFIAVAIRLAYKNDLSKVE